jgi:hypothetical protein
VITTGDIDLRHSYPVTALSAETLVRSRLQHWMSVRRQNTWLFTADNDAGSRSCCAGCIMLPVCRPLLLSDRGLVQTEMLAAVSHTPARQT